MAHIYPTWVRHFLGEAHLHHADGNAEVDHHDVRKDFLKVEEFRQAVLFFKVRRPEEKFHGGCFVHADGCLDSGRAVDVETCRRT